MFNDFPHKNFPVVLRQSLETKCEFETHRNIYIIPNTNCFLSSENIITANMVTSVGKNVCVDTTHVPRIAQGEEEHFILGIRISLFFLRRN